MHTNAFTSDKTRHGGNDGIKEGATMPHMMWFYFCRYLQENREKREALREIRANGWRSADVMRSEATRHATSWKRALR